MRDVTAILMGDPSARVVRRPTTDESERTRLAELSPTRKKADRRPQQLSEFGRKARAMNVGDSVQAATKAAGYNMAALLRREYGWVVKFRPTVPHRASLGGILVRVK
jgi:hypothetical protein